MTGIEPAYSAWEVDSKGSGRTHTGLWELPTCVKHPRKSAGVPSCSAQL
ncbi:MAG: hypothetical protein JWR48_2855 [Mycobacterium sp.]|jgi:hypothetical protein|nr:hypothetical protein [Mycobacterium sp.]